MQQKHKTDCHRMELVCLFYKNMQREKLRWSLCICCVELGRENGMKTQQLMCKIYATKYVQNSNDC